MPAFPPFIAFTMNNAALPAATTEFQQAGFAVLPNLFGPAEVSALLHCIENAPASGPNFRRSQEVFAIRNLLGEIPALWPLLDTPALREVLASIFPDGCHLVKAIYFDKPAQSNWLVAWHQDLMINVARRANLPGFGPWTTKADWVSVQPPVAVLENTCTIHPPAPRRLRRHQRRAESGARFAPAGRGTSYCYSDPHARRGRVRRARRRSHADASAIAPRLQPQQQRPAAPGGTPGIRFGRAAGWAGMARATSRNGQ